MNQTMHRVPRAMWVVVLAVAGALVVWWLGESTEPRRSKHALVIGIDGMRADALRAAATPEIDLLAESGTTTHDAFAGGRLGTAEEQPTMSGPGWTSVLTGVWADKHGVRSNGFRGGRLEEFPHFFHRIREVRADAVLSSFVSWKPIHGFILGTKGADTTYSPDVRSPGERDSAIADAVVDHLGSRDPTVVFVHFGELDHAGHAFGFGPDVPEYIEALERIDVLVGHMVAAVRGRPGGGDEDWLILVTTDHGGVSGRHGGQLPEERTIPLIVSGGDVSRGEQEPPGPGHVVVPPTVLRHLNIPVDPSWGWVGSPFGID